MKNLFLFTGEETYLLQEYAKSWKDAFKEKHGDLNLTSLDAREAGVREIMTAIETLPFLGEKRLVFVYGLPDAPPARESEEPTEKDKKRDEELKKFETYLEEIPKTSVVAFVQPRPDKRRSFYKKLAKSAETKEFRVLQGKELMGWVMAEAKKKGATIHYDTAEYLIGLVGPNLFRLAQEISKYTSFAPGVAITRQTIDALTTPSLEANIFHLTDALGAKDHREAIHNLHMTLAAGENLRPVFYMIVRQFRLLLSASGFLRQSPGADSLRVASALKLHPFVAKNTLQQLKYFSLPELAEAYGQLLAIDIGLKNSQIRTTTDDQDELALAIERFILKFCSKR
ncbi:DNA polymerase III subunit delta [Candidatus Peregrinibacteria bacterium]|nr:DNA polymerase III subunit delta [Candidatus Peregrinibacteria bacterium]